MQPVSSAIWRTRFRFAGGAVRVHCPRLRRLADQPFEDGGVLGRVGVVELPVRDQLGDVRAKYRLRLGPGGPGRPLRVVGELVEETEQVAGDALTGGDRRRLHHLDHRVHRQYLRRGEREPAALGVIGTRLEKASEGAGVEAGHESRDPLSGSRLPCSGTPRDFLRQLTEVVQHHAIVRDLADLIVDRPRDDERIGAVG